MGLEMPRPTAARENFWIAIIALVSHGLLFSVAAPSLLPVRSNHLAPAGASPSTLVAPHLSVERAGPTAWNLQGS